MEELNAVAKATERKDDNNDDGIWLGGRLTSAGHWVWSDGSIWDFDNWDKEDPNVRYGTQGANNNCTAMWKDKTWWDWPCGTLNMNRFPCQKLLWTHKKTSICAIRLSHKICFSLNPSNRPDS